MWGWGLISRRHFLRPGSIISNASSPSWAARTRSSWMTMPIWMKRLPESLPVRSDIQGRKRARLAPPASWLLGEIHDVLLARLIEAAKSLKIAPASDPGCKIGPVIDADAMKRIQKAIEQGKADSRLAWAGDVGALAGEGYFIAPHIFADVNPASILATEEIFGPVLAVMRAKDMAEALAIANGTRYALTGGIYSRSPANLERARKEFRVGNLYINRRITGALVGRQPFGGFKLSGAGTQAGGPDYLRHFVLPRCITENTVRHGFIPSEGH